MKRRKTTVQIISSVVVIACSLSLLLSSCGTSPTVTESPDTLVTISGDFSKAYTNGRFVVWTPKQSDDGASQGSSMMMAASTSSSAAPSIEDSIDIVEEAPINADGTFSLSAEVFQPQRVYFYVLDATTEEGMKLAPTKGQQFILEPGELTITMEQNRQFTVSGGHLNDTVINSWKMSDEYVGAQTAQSRLRVTPEEETEEQYRTRMDELSELSNQLLELEVAGLSTLASTHDEPQVRKLALQMSWLIGDWYWEALVKLADDLPEDAWVKEKSVAAIDRIEKNEAQAKIAIGTEILDFTAEDLSGKTVSLNELKQEKSLVLLEFWASWCGPCRVEIPHMKKAYEKFKDKGFEIVSFTIDDSKEDWELASEEEDLPWPNLGMGQEADAATKYSVTGVPANYLFDARTGTIIALDLRGHKLDEVLEEKLL
ncbi:MAG: AhpC/TSA family protein [Gammaproteobacteria bacterium]|nr:AhpC/TSA family protein [Gammaproteobacteria bacterium]MYF38018.1 AhpC/TSA family protein [Gammaproteobacteria bacterium]